MRSNQNRGITLVELVVTMGILVILFAIFVPAMRTGSSEAARRVTCMNNLRQVALATMNYESANMAFPRGTGVGVGERVGSSHQLSGIVEILPFMDADQLYDHITQPNELQLEQHPAFPPLHDRDFEPWQTQIATFRCPSLSADASTFAQIHYGLCLGDRARNIAAPESKRGGFAGALQITFADITDGSSNSIMVGEMGGNAYRATESPYAINQPASMLENPAEVFSLATMDLDPWSYQKKITLSPIGRGGHWADGRAGIAYFNTILPPGSPSAAINGSVGVDGVYSASGPHPEGLSIVLFDGSTHLLSFDIDAGDSRSATPTVEEMAARSPSPYGVWGALGTINSEDVVEPGSF